ncbi:hypothetical protein GIB67_016963 [Kingdonia uniflora]|uniref:Mediator complex subunit 15 KIX domain-containing protein n=1 Tax=Kingdonia uniflora TaxID=39325 RepID=A0A7J7M3H4_9MAGN|nr:hypothetical protein GIB67_016963 [Kingdonia uniflora]
METNNWRASNKDKDNNNDDDDVPDWRLQLQPDSRQRIVNKIMETLKKYFPISVPDGLQELKKIATRLEEKTYDAATSQSDYLRKISLKMLTMETKVQNTVMPNSDKSTTNQNPADLGYSLYVHHDDMGGNNSRASQSKPLMDSSDWRAQLHADFRKNVVNEIMETLRRHLPVSGSEGQLEHKKNAIRFEEMICGAATSQADYERKISLVMLTMETSESTSMPNSLQPKSSASNNPPAPGLTQPIMQNDVGQSSNLQGITSISQIPVGNNYMGLQGMPSNHLALQRPMQRKMQRQQQLLSMQSLAQRSYSSLQKPTLEPSLLLQQNQQQKTQQNQLVGQQLSNATIGQNHLVRQFLQQQGKGAGQQQQSPDISSTLLQPFRGQQSQSQVVSEHQQAQLQQLVLQQSLVRQQNLAQRELQMESCNVRLDEENVRLTGENVRLTAENMRIYKKNLDYQTQLKYLKDQIQSLSIDIDLSLRPSEIQQNMNLGSQYSRDMLELRQQACILCSIGQRIQALLLHQEVTEQNEVFPAVVHPGASSTLLESGAQIEQKNNVDTDENSFEKDSKDSIGGFRKETEENQAFMENLQNLSIKLERALQMNKSSIPSAS